MVAGRVLWPTECGARCGDFRWSTLVHMEAPIYRKVVVVAIVSLTALLTACGNQGSSPTDVQPTASATAVASATSVPAATATAVSSNSPSPAPEQTSPTASPTAAPLVETPSESTATSGVTVTFTDESVARYLVKEQLARLSLPNDAVGETRDVAGSVVLSADGVVDSGASTVIIGLASLKSDEGRRDGYVRDRTLNTRGFPDATVTVNELLGLPWPLPTSGEFTVQLATDTTIRGVTSPLEWEAMVTFDGDEIVGLAQTSFPFATFGMSPPRLAFILSVEDNIRLELDFVATVAAGG